MSDRIFGIVGLTVAAFFIWAAGLIQESFVQDPVGPKAFPVALAIIMAIASLVIIIKPDAEPDWPDLRATAEIAIAVGVLFTYSFALPEIGFVISTVFAAGFLSWRLGAPPVKAAIAGLVISVGLYVIFHLILGLSVAKGPFGF